MYIFLNYFCCIFLVVSRYVSILDLNLYLNNAALIFRHVGNMQKMFLSCMYYADPDSVGLFYNCSLYCFMPFTFSTVVQLHKTWDFQ